MRNEFDSYKHTRKFFNTTWEYYDIGTTEQVLLILPNMLVYPKEWEWYVERLKSKYRIIIPIYPKIANLETIVEQLSFLLGELKVNQITIIGDSLGGMIAQVFAGSYPEKIKRVVLIATIGPHKIFGLCALLLFSFAFCAPSFLVMSFVSVATWISLSKTSRGEWWTILKKHIWQYHTKSYVLLLSKVIIDFCLQTQFHKRISNTIPLTIISARNDMVFPFFFHNLHTIYPHASFISFSQGRHLVALNRPEDILKALRFENDSRI